MLRLGCAFFVEHSIDTSGGLPGSLCQCARVLPVVFPRSATRAGGPRRAGRGRRFIAERIRDWKLMLLRSSRSSSLIRIFRARGIAALGLDSQLANRSLCAPPHHADAWIHGCGWVYDEKRKRTENIEGFEGLALAHIQLLTGAAVTARAASMPYHVRRRICADCGSGLANGTHAARICDVRRGEPLAEAETGAGCNWGCRCVGT